MHKIKEKEQLYRDYFKGVIAEELLIKEITEIDLAAEDARSQSFEHRYLRLIMELISPSTARKFR